MATCPQCGGPRMTVRDDVRGIHRTSRRHCLDCHYVARVYSFKYPGYAPNQTPYTSDELTKLGELIDDACEDDPGEQNEPR